MITTPYYRLQRIALIAAAALVFLTGGYILLRYSVGPIEFADPQLEAALRETLGDGPMTRSDLERITNLDAAYFGITDTTGITLLSNLRVLNLSGNPGISIHAIADLPHLEELVLRDLAILDLDEIGGSRFGRMRNLKRIDLGNNPELADIDHLRDVPQLRELVLRNTAVRDLDPLQVLTTLRRLDLRETSPTRSGLQVIGRLGGLEYLNLRECDIDTLEPLADLTNLYYLNIHSNPGIDSLEPVRSMRRLQTLILRNVPLGDQLDAIAALTTLQRLNIRNTGISDLTPLAELMHRGGLQDDPDGGVFADVDIRDNPVQGSLREGSTGYDVLQPYWEAITHREPARLPRAPTGEVRINEVMTSNRSVSVSPDEGYPDWIELYNPGDQTVNLGGYYLSDDIREPDKWRIPEGISIAPDDFLLVHATGEDYQASSGAVHTNFRLNAGGAAVVLSEPNRRRRVDLVHVPAIPRDSSFGRDSSGAMVPLFRPTPGGPNRDTDRYLPVTFSHPAGFHHRGFTLRLETHPDAEIFFTLDGSEPDPSTVPVGQNRGRSSYQVMDHQTHQLRPYHTHTYRYTAPIDIKEQTLDPDGIAGIRTTVPEADLWTWNPPEETVAAGTVVRAISYLNGVRCNVQSRSFFVLQDAEDHPALASISILMDPERLFGYDQGLYVPGRIHAEDTDRDSNWMRTAANYGERWEAPAHIAMYEPDGVEGFALDAGARVHGGWSRSHPLKSLRLYARKDYHRVNYFEHPLFPGATRENSHHALNRFKRLMLRSGQSLFRSHLQDLVTHNHARDSVAVDLLRGRPVVHWINGEYWGIKNLRERFDRFFLEGAYGIDPEEVIIIDGPLGYDRHLDTGRPGENRDFRDVLAYAEQQDLADPQHFEELARRIDMESFIDYNVVRIFSGDPDGVTKHVAVWRKRTTYDPDAPLGHDGRWRWHTWDFDNALMFVENDTMTLFANDRLPEDQEEYFDAIESRGEEVDSMLFGATAADRPAMMRTVHHPAYTTLIVNLLKNDTFRDRFINRFADLMNTIYREDVHAAAIRNAAEGIAPEMHRHIARWGYPATYRYWETQVERNIAFAHRRPEIQRQQIRHYFRERDIEIGEPVDLRIMYAGSDAMPPVQTRINSITAAVSAAWTGRFFSNVPIEIQVEPPAGYRFLRWEISETMQQSDETTYSFTVPRDTTVTGILESIP